MSIRVAIVEDDKTVSENLAKLIDKERGYSCVAQCGSAEEAWQTLPSVGPEVVLMDIHLPGRNGIACVERLRKLIPKTQVIMLTIEENSDRIFESLKAGATGYLVKHAAPQEILDAIKDVQLGGAPMTGSIARKVVTAFRQPTTGVEEDSKLSQREEQVLRLLARGHRSKEIADELGIGLGTVNTYVRHIYEKLHVRTRAEAVLKLKTQ